MKKNRMMRLASGLLVAVLATTSMISGTYAKYVTKTTAADTARVAKWGVEVSATTALFEEKYATDDKTGTFKFAGDYSVDANDDKDVIAPGTKGSMVFSVTGTPEVAVNVKVEFDKVDGTLSMVTLPGVAAGTEYIDYTQATYATGDVKAKYNETFTLTENYYPVLWTLKKADTLPTDWTTVSAVTDMEEVNLQAVETYFDTLSKNYDPNTDLNAAFGYYELSWEWPYESGHDEADTYLGNVIANVPADIDKTGVITTEAFDLEITVTQID